MSKFLGIDTSCYTTSVAVFDEEQGIVAEERIVLRVKTGNRGLSQSEMVFQHTKNLPVILKKIESCLQDIHGVGVSVSPRRRADSYMPAFLVGKGFAQAISSVHKIPLFPFSHQENHALAAIRIFPELWNQPFYMMHLSGGTQDILSVDWNMNTMEIRNLIHSKDITAGQFIDRIGVSLGLPFPAGQKLEDLALSGADTYQVPVAKIKDAFSYAGAETQVQRDIAKKIYAKADIASGVITAIANSLKRVIGPYPFKQQMPFISVGGVMSNLYLRTVIGGICREKNLLPIFADPKFSSDNATGNAFGSCMRYKDENLHCSRM